MQYVRVYTGYVPYNEERMINLAVMNPLSKVILFDKALIMHCGRYSVRFPFRQERHC